MKAIQGPKTWDEYVDLVHQAVYEIDELLACMNEEDELDDVDLYNQFAGELDRHLRALYASMLDGSYRFPAEEDLPYMPLVQRYGRFIPFRGLLELINRVHRRGLETD